MGKTSKKAAKATTDKIVTKRMRGPSKDRTAELTKELIAAVEPMIDPKEKYTTGEKEHKEGKLLMFQWAIEGGPTTPRQWLIAQGYSPRAAEMFFEILPQDEWREKRRSLQDGVTEKIAKRYVDKIAEMSESHLKSSNLIHLKAVEYLSKLSIEPARDGKGKIIVDGNGKPVFRGIRSQDLVNAAVAVKESQAIMRKALGINDRDDFGLQQILNKIEQKNEIHNTQINIINTEDSKIAKAVERLDYDDIVDLIKARRRKAREIEAKRIEEEGADAE